ncbi:RNA polymerase sigma-70 factor (ECF subfamily) [Sphingomonas kyeonggiensis]|uniref:RNA polymerase sigma factor n=1 Tax=Sphingomonas kyeonggiensis TaxID=1268553 RepID=UPI002780C8B2|nr:RNA polymerase sigma factor [Sphingomonas kyeonggiensis]MDQ0249410.1 RNA polymerase sigma-70 factor (ECF subfamily) [Sphingomonas kyeonggiensis]
MDEDLVSAWIGREILPHERGVRSWLARRWGHVLDPNDVIQEAYCRIASLGSVDHIRSPMAYFYRTAQTVAADIMRRSGVINFTSMTEIEWLNVMDSAPLADRTIAAAQEIERVNGVLSELSDTARKAIELRRIEGVSQRETAERLGVSEDVVRNHLVRGVQKVLQRLAAQDAEMSGDARETMEQKAEAVDTSRSL